MSNQQTARFGEVVRELADKVRRYRQQYRDRSLGEENTKASLIDPLLEALGWNIRDPDEVHHEFRPSPRDNPVDYCLRLQRDPRLLIEAKGLGEDLQDRRWVHQTLGYATMAGAKWCVLTDGDEYLIYNATEAVDADGKLFCRIKLSDGRDEDAVNVLGLISRGNVEKDVLSSLWKSHFIDRRVKSTLRELVDTADRKLISLIRRRVAGLSPKEIAASLRRLDIKIEAPGSPHQTGRRQEGILANPPARKAKRQKGQRDPGRHSLRLKFWQSLLSHPKATNTRFANIKPGEYSWIGAGSGVHGVPFIYAVGQHEGRVELFISRTGKPHENKRIFDWLEKRRAEIDADFGRELSWQRLDKKQSCRIAQTLTAGGYRSDESEWPAIQDAMIDAMMRLEKALTPYLAKLKAELTA